MTKEQRGEKWDNEFIPCKHHPERRCNRAGYLQRASRCWECRTGKYKRLAGTKARNREKAKTLKCKLHPDRPCMVGYYVLTGSRRCSFCFHSTPQQIRHKEKYSKGEQRKWRRRSSYLAQRIKEQKI